MLEQEMPVDEEQSLNGMIPMYIGSACLYSMHTRRLGDLGPVNVFSCKRLVESILTTIGAVGILAEIVFERDQ